jgi:hypothetical protein
LRKTRTLDAYFQFEEGPSCEELMWKLWPRTTLCNRLLEGHAKLPAKGSARG